MSAPPGKPLIETIAAELGVDPAFVEKDWHAMRLVGLVAGVSFRNWRPVFGGGTSLSKAFGLIRRFSEDVDFKVLTPVGGQPTRADRRDFRNAVVAAVREVEDWRLDDADVQPGNESRYFTCLIAYESTFARPQALRSRLRLEMTVASPALPVEDRPAQSFVSQARGDAPEAPVVACVSPVETAADKLSALTWRVLTRTRGSAGDDPSLIRHLHDLAALESRAQGDAAFAPLLLERLGQDAARGRPLAAVQGLAAVDRVAAALAQLEQDRTYEDEYRRFVLAMSYADEGQTPSFGQALEAVRRLASILGNIAH